ncbi:hypothetical protein OEZ60_13935 [Defluviimonas sp. WL0024]|uniref:Uncharacterized protein n=2 Tax=Albidovulum TaxID=205889 RepID=A0ABT3J544_9RHOB|nr:MULTISPECIES: hypothetical protein [Defluviimonas]MCU9849102.1 hypothetical protein [Defluviimonas sp. WL0024]MCW3782771.1 hypothetical protein [Defluviimonas salinarum]
MEASRTREVIAEADVVMVLQGREPPRAPKEIEAVSANIVERVAKVTGGVLRG